MFKILYLAMIDIIWKRIVHGRIEVCCTLNWQSSLQTEYWNNTAETECHGVILHPRQLASKLLTAHYYCWFIQNS